MVVLGIQGSPRKNGNTDYLLSLFLQEAESRGCRSEILRPSEKQVVPCTGCGFCERKGVCAIDNSLETGIFPLFRKADLIVFSCPVYFYGVPALTKAMIDRSQTLWSRKYRFGLKDPGHGTRKGILLSAGATRGKELFDGIKLTVSYFFDAIGASLDASLCYRGIDLRSEIQKHPGVGDDIRSLVQETLAPVASRKTVVFSGTGNGSRSLMAYGFARHLAGDRVEPRSISPNPSVPVDPMVVEVMAEKHLDLAFMSADQSLPAAGPVPDAAVSFGPAAAPAIDAKEHLYWDIPELAAGSDMETARRVRDAIETGVIRFLQSFH